MKSHLDHLAELLASGPLQIGQTVTIPPRPDSTAPNHHLICHYQDYPNVSRGHTEGLTCHTDPEEAHEIALYAPDGHYRFTKGELSLRTGWFFSLAQLKHVRIALEHLHPAALGLWRAKQNGTLRIQNVRDKLNRQTGMYRNARHISDAGLQNLINTTCGPANCCVKKILWQLDENTPLEPNQASTHDGTIPPLPHSNEHPDPPVQPIAHVIPLYCQEACNHFVAQARKVSKKEYDAANQSS